MRNLTVLFLAVVMIAITFNFAQAGELEDKVEQKCSTIDYSADFSVLSSNCAIVITMIRFWEHRQEFMAASIVKAKARKSNTPAVTAETTQVASAK
jgi:hypothetical protein